MLSDPTTVAELKAEWDGVVRMRTRMQRLVVGTFAFGAAPVSPGVAKVVYNLPLLLAYDVLSQVLDAARREGLFSSPRRSLGDLLTSAKPALTWLDWDELRAGVHRRNAVAHDGELFDGKACIRDIELIERQLAAWGVLRMGEEVPNA